MRKIIPAIMLVAFFYASCDMAFKKTVTGNGTVATSERNINSADRIRSYGSFDITVVQGRSPSVTVEADENLMQYIITENQDGALIIKSKDDYNLRSDNKIKVTVTTDALEELSISGSGNVVGQGKFSGRNHLNVNISGSGDVKLDVNTPKIESSIAGSGNIELSGETRDSKIEIAGDGDYNAGSLMSENVEIHVAGSGNAYVHAAAKLDIHIAGSGDVHYKGSPSISQDIAGSGKITKED